MNEERALIEEYVAGALPQGKVSGLALFDKSPSSGNRFTAKGHVSLSRGRSFDAYFLIEGSPSLAVLKDAIAMLEWNNGDDLNGQVTILLTEYLSQKRQELLRQSKIGFIDSTGNAWIDSENLLIDKRGNKAPSTSSPGRIQSVFADKATLVTRLLFCSGPRGIREISLMLGDAGFSLTPGYVSKVVNTLVAEHYAKRTEKGIILINKESLLEDWVAVYKRKRVHRETAGWYYPEARLDGLARMVGSRLGESGMLTERAGAFFVEPYASFDSVDVLARDAEKLGGILEDMGARPVDRGANINVIKPCYSVSSFFGSREAQGIHVASDIQLYLDLHHQPKRGLEAAEHLYQLRILPLIEKETNDE